MIGSAFSLLSALAAVAVAPAALAYTVHEVSVGGLQADGITPMLAFSPPYLNATPGDVVRFTFHVKNHTVTQSSFEAPCSKLTDASGSFIGFDSGFMPVDPSATTATTFNITVNSSAPIWGYCRQSGATPNAPTHCQSGMVFGINPPPAGEKTFFNYQTLARFSTTQAAQAMGESVKVHDVVVGGLKEDGVSPNLVYIPNNITAGVGEKVRFHFQVKNHTVTQSSFEAPCSKLVDAYGNPSGFDSGFTPVNASNLTATASPTFEITVNSTTPIWGYCRQTGATPGAPTHCQSGMTFAINSPESGVKTFANYQTLARFSTTQAAQAAGNSEKVHDVVVGGLQGDGVTPNLVYIPNNITAKEGEKVVFHFSVNNHTVTQSSFASPCSKLVNSYNQPIGFDSGFTPVSNASLLESESPTFTITVNDSTTPIWAYCRQLGKTPAAPTHCQSGMVLGINAPSTGNTIDAFIANARASTSQTGVSASFPESAGGSTAAGTYTSSAWYASSSSFSGYSSYGSSKDLSGDSLSNAISDSDSNSDSNASLDKLLTYVPAILGLLSGAVLLLLILLVLAIVMIRHHGWKGVSGVGATRNLAPSYRPVQLDGPGRNLKGAEVERYHDSEGLYAEGPVH